jgi:hypothetical protein
VVQAEHQVLQEHQELPVRQVRQVQVVLRVHQELRERRVHQVRQVQVELQKFTKQLHQHHLL